MPRPEVSIIIPARNEAESVERCLESLLAQKGLDGGFEILFCDGMSDDGTREIVSRIARRDCRIRMIDNPRRIVSTALNEGIRQARGEFVLRVDAHTKFSEHYAAKCIEILHRTGADNVGGPWRAVSGGSLISRSIAATFQHPFSVGGARSHDVDYEGEIDTIYLGCWNKRIFDECGYFDEELVRNQDDEFNLRLTRLGKRLWQSPEIRCWYRARGSLWTLCKQYFQYGFWKILVMRKHRTVPSLRHVVPLIFLCGLLAGAVLSFLHPLLAYIYAGVCASYLLTVLAVSVLIARRSGADLLLPLPFTILTFHLAYGAGSLFGVAHFILLRRSAHQAGDVAKRLTR